MSWIGVFERSMLHIRAWEAWNEAVAMAIKSGREDLVDLYEPKSGAKTRAINNAATKLTIAISVHEGCNISKDG